MIVLTANGCTARGKPDLARAGNRTLRAHLQDPAHPAPGRRRTLPARDQSQANLTEGRHDLARRVFHGKKGEVTKAYYDGMEDQLSALAWCSTPSCWSTVYMDRALAELRRQGYPVLGEDLPCLFPFVRHHISIDGHYSFQLPVLGGTHRALCDTAADDDE